MLVKTMQQDAASKERLEFSLRLQRALDAKGYAPDSPTYLAREFNLRTSDRAVTTHGARKWLTGEAFPTQEKLRVLATWLEVPVEWLRFGTEHNAPTLRPSTVTSPAMGAKQLALLQNIKKLSHEQQDLIHKVVLSMLTSSPP